TAALHDAVARLCSSDPALLDAFFHLTSLQRLMWEVSAPAWHGLARADVFLTGDGPKVCELNSDTPSGEAEAVLLNAFTPGPAARDPNAGFERHFCRMVAAAAEHDGP